MNGRNCLYNLLWAVLMTAGLIALVPMSCYLCGCSSVVEGLRFAPGEEQRQSAQAAADLAAGGSLVGLPPDSDAAAMLAAAARPAAAYAGAPDKSVDVRPALITAGRQWRTMEAQLAALKVRERISTETAVACKTALAELMARLADAKKAVQPGEVIPIAQAIVQMEDIGRRIAAAVEVPEAQLSEAERAASQQVKALTLAVSDLASGLANRPVTLGEVGDRAVGAVTNAADKAVGWIDQIAQSPAAVSILTALGLGSVGGGLALRNRSRRRAEEDAAYDAELAAAKAKAETLAQQRGSGEPLMSALLAAVLDGKAKPAAPAETATSPSV